MSGSLVSLTIAVAAGTTAIITGLIKFASALEAHWRKTIGLRREQSKLYNQLACGATPEFITSLLGEAKFQRQIDGRIERTFRFTGAWVVVEFETPHAEHNNTATLGSVVSFSITITDNKFYFDTSQLTAGLLSAKLGATLAEELPKSIDQYYWVGMSAGWSYLKHYYFGNPGGYQMYWLSHNDVGTGPAPSKSFTYRSGRYGERPCSDPSALAAVGVNTLTVLGPVSPKVQNEFFGRDRLGADRELVRLDRTGWRLRNSTLKTKLAFKLRTALDFRRSSMAG